MKLRAFVKNEKARSRYTKITSKVSKIPNLKLIIIINNKLKMFQSSMKWTPHCAAWGLSMYQMSHIKQIPMAFERYQSPHLGRWLKRTWILNLKELYNILITNLLRIIFWKFHGSPVIKTWHFHCREPEFNPCSGNQKNKTKTNKQKKPHKFQSIAKEKINFLQLPKYICKDLSLASQFSQ